MVKKLETRYGPTPQPDLVRSARMILRLHPDLVEVVEQRAKEMNMSRSKMLEQVMLGYLMNDPRNPKMTNFGMIDRKQTTPLSLREANPHKFAERWQKFVIAHNAIFGTPPKTAWADEPEGFWTPYDTDPNTPETEEEAADAARAAARVTKKKADAKEK